jgi:hypothetical protein
MKVSIGLGLSYLWTGEIGFSLIGDIFWPFFVPTTFEGNSRVTGQRVLIRIWTTSPEG